jgi:hypothetical protein
MYRQLLLLKDLEDLGRAVATAAAGRGCHACCSACSQLMEPPLSILCCCLSHDCRCHLFLHCHCTATPLLLLLLLVLLVVLLQVRVVILGQDPYINPGEAMGLSFSVPPGVRVPPSLANMYKELSTDVGCVVPNHGCLEKVRLRDCIHLEHTAG